MTSLSTTAGMPAALWRRPVRVLRPLDATDSYAYPRPELSRLAAHGVLHRLAYGYYAIAPAARIGDSAWIPAIEAVAWGIAAADYGVDRVAVMGVSAARVHAAIPRALAVAVVAVPKQRASLHLVDRDAEVIFVKRDVARLDVERTTTELGDGWVTTIEQTLLDLVTRPALGGVTVAASEALNVLLSAADRDLLEDLATAQRRRPTLRRFLAGTQV